MKTVCRSLIAFLGVATITMTSLAKTPAGDGQPAQPGKSQQLASPDQVPEGLGKSDWHSIRAAYEAGRHAVQPVEGGWQARNPGQQWTTRFDRRGFLATPREGDWTWGLELRSYGFGERRNTVGGKPAVKTEGSRLSYQWDDTVEEWFVNDSRGLEHGFTVSRRPEGAVDGSPLGFLIATRGTLQPISHFDAQGLSFQDADGGTVLNYSGLKVWDADGKILPSRFETVGKRLVRLLVDETGARYPLTIDPIAQQAYLKAGNNGPPSTDFFGLSVAVSGDTVVVGAYGESSSTTGVNSTPNESARLSGAAYVFVRSGSTWSQQAYLKASNTGANDWFGNSVAVSGDTLVVGADGEDSSTTGVNSTPNESGGNSGAAYVFVRSGNTWSQQAYLKASNTGAGDSFGKVAVSGDTVVVGANREDSSSTGVNSVSNNSAIDSGAAYVFVRVGNTWSQQAYLKASNTGANDRFGRVAAVSGDTVVVGAHLEGSSTTGVNSTPNDSAAYSGASYIFVRSGITWSQQAYLKASNTGAGDGFGISVAVSGETVAVGADGEDGEDSSSTGVNSVSNNNASTSGAAYVFVRNGSAWSQQAYLKASNTGLGDSFGWSVAVSGDTVAVGAFAEDSSTAGVNSSPNESASFSGAAYVYVRSGSTWSQQAYLKASNTGAEDYFGFSVAVSVDTVVVGAYLEDSSTTGVNSVSNEGASNSGAAYVYGRSGSTWSQQAYLKASNTPGGSGAGDLFGISVAVSGDTVVVGARDEDGGTTGVNSTPNESATNSGAAYVFARSGSTWIQQAYLKASNTEANDGFGYSVAVSGDTVVVGAYGEDSSSTGVNSSPNNSATDSGAAYVFMRSSGTWSQRAYLKASNTGAGDNFGYSVAVSGDTVVVGAYLEDSSTMGINTTPDEFGTDSGAAYVFIRNGSTWSQQAYLKASNTGANDYFGRSVAVSGDTVVLGAHLEDSNTTGVNSVSNNFGADSGAAYVFIRSGSTWIQQAYLKASNTGRGDWFGNSVAVSGDTVVVGAEREDSSTTGVNSTPDDNAYLSGAAYVFLRSSGNWSQQAYLKASNTGESDAFGNSVAVSGDTVVVGAYAEDSSTDGVNGTPNETATDSGAAYVFVRSGSSWSQKAYLKASSTGISDQFGISVAVSADTVIVGTPYEDSSTTGVNSSSDETAVDSGAAYIFTGLGSIPADIAVEAPTGNEVASGIGMLDFGQTAPGQTADQAFTLRNAGGESLTSVAASITGPDAAHFTLFTSPPSSLAGGASATFIVSFAPTTPGVKTATLAIASSDGDENPFTLALTGRGNTAPASTGYATSTSYQSAATISLTDLLAGVTDPEGDAFSVTAAGPASTQGGSAVLQAGSILYTPPGGFSGMDSFPVTVSDIHGAGTIANVTVSVSGPFGAGTDPPQVTSLPNGDKQVRFQAIPGRSYRILRSTNMSDWTAIGSPVAGGTGIVEFTDEDPPEGSAFYRLAFP